MADLPAGDHRTKLLRTVVDGLMPFWQDEIATWPANERQHAAVESADLISCGADELWNTSSRRDVPRGKVATAITKGIAVLAYLPGGVDWAGGHWCVAPHQGCPKRAARAVNGAAL